MNARTPVYVSLQMPEPCSLVQGREMRTVRASFVDAGKDSPKPGAEFAQDYLAQGGQPMTGGYMTLACAQCRICLPARMVLKEFNERADHRNVVRRNIDLSMSLHDDIPTPNLQKPGEYQRLYRAYKVARFHGGDGKKLPTMNATFEMLSISTFTGMTPLRVDARDAAGKLQGCAYFHTAGDDAYAAAFFYAPKRRVTSLGQAMLLYGVRHLQARGFNYLYLAHWTREATDYSWKDGFTPLDLFIDGAWTRAQGKGAIRALRVGSGPAYPKR